MMFTRDIAINQQTPTSSSSQLLEGIPMNRSAITIIFSAVALVLSGSLAAAAPIYSYSAALDTPGDGIWENELAVTNTREFAFNPNGSYSPVDVTGTTGTLLTRAYEFGLGGIDNANMTDGSSNVSLRDSDMVSGDTAADIAASFEIWIRPADADITDGVTPNATFRQWLFDTGGEASGLGLWLRQSTDANGDAGALEFVAGAEGPDMATHVSISAAIGGVSDFTQAVFVLETGDIDGQADGTDTRLVLYLNGTEAASSLLEEDTDTQWYQGGNAGGLSDAGGDLGPTKVTGEIDDIDFEDVDYEGQLALFNLYDESLSAAAVRESYTAIVPEPASATMIGLGGILILARRRRA